MMLKESILSIEILRSILIRILDIFISSIALIFLSPLFILISLILLFTGEGEILYLQKRIGKNGKIFNLYKFATMLKDSPMKGAGELTEKNDPRVLPVGKYLRKSKINELPQLLNILFGQMSVVGPRPQTEIYFSLYSKNVKKNIIKVKPGLTGVGSVVFRDEESLFDLAEDPHIFDRNILVPYKGELEIWFSKNISVFLYFKLIFLTAYVLFFPSKKYAFSLLRDLPKPPKEIDIMIKKLSK